ncbi:hypothetical protein MMC15_007496 [Xylographa vitiligo]|nr:hypothetical protein [Xylographa vitiligo]
MTASLPAKKDGFRHRLYERLNRVRSESRSGFSTRLHSTTEANLNPVTIWRQEKISSSASVSQYATSTASSLLSNQASDLAREPTTSRVDNARIQSDQSASQTSNLEKSSLGRSSRNADIDSVVFYSDLWSVAYRDAVHNLGKDIDLAILKGKNVAEFFRELEETDKEATQESAFLRGVKYLRSIQVALERFKLALDLASPLTSIEPTATTVFGVVSCVTAVSLCFENIHSLQFLQE